MARDDKQQYNMPVRQQEAPGRLSRSPFGWGRDADFWTASPFQLMRRMSGQLPERRPGAAAPEGRGGAPADAAHSDRRRLRRQGSRGGLDGRPDGPVGAESCR